MPTDAEYLYARAKVPIGRSTELGARACSLAQSAPERALPRGEVRRGLVLSLVRQRRVRRLEPAGALLIVRRAWTYAQHAAGGGPPNIVLRAASAVGGPNLRFMSGRIVVATGGWSAPEWYPPGFPARDRLQSLAERLEAVEIDSSFYALPAARTVQRWAKITPDGFGFTAKLHRALSRHAAPLKSLPGDLRDGVELTDRGRVVLDEDLEAGLCARTLEVFEPLYASGRLGCFLLQLTPAFNPGEHRLAELEPLLQALAPVPVAIELRHRDWMDRRDATLGWFREVGAAFVSVDAPVTTSPVAMPRGDAVTRGDLAYLRAHGRNAEAYVRGRSAGERFNYAYSDAELDELSERARALAQDAERVACVLSNGGHALESALALRARLE